jgi:hypothetical protein
MLFLQANFFAIFHYVTIPQPLIKAHKMYGIRNTGWVFMYYLLQLICEGVSVRNRVHLKELSISACQAQTVWFTLASRRFSVPRRAEFFLPLSDSLGPNFLSLSDESRFLLAGRLRRDPETDAFIGIMKWFKKWQYCNWDCLKRSTLLIGNDSDICYIQQSNGQAFPMEISIMRERAGRKLFILAPPYPVPILSLCFLCLAKLRGAILNHSIDFLRTEAEVRRVQLLSFILNGR